MTQPDATTQDIPPTSQLGSRLKSIRRFRSITMRQVADGTGLSKSLISQIETGTVNPSITSLKKIGDFLGVSIGELFEDGSSSVGTPNAETTPVSADFVHVVPHDRRRTLVFPVTLNESFMLTGDMQHQLEVMITTMKPGTSSGGEHYSHKGEEVAWIMDGSLEVTIAGQSYLLGQGDSIHFAAHLPHHYRSAGDVMARFIAIVTPPSF